MKDIKGKWPRGGQHAPPKDHLHALGVISLNYNTFEVSLFGLFRHHLELSGMSRKLTQSLYGELNGGSRAEIIKALYAEYEKDPIVREHVGHSLAFFAWCFEARNLLMHAHHNAIVLDDREKVLSLAKHSTSDYSKLNFMHLSLEQIRRIADSIYAGYVHLFNLYAYLEERDGLGLRELKPGSVPTLPKKPPIPRGIALRDRPAVRAMTSGGSSEWRQVTAPVSLPLRN